MSEIDSSSDESNINNLEEEISAMDIDSNREINILLIGETGVGKSTFINAFSNYLHYSDLKTAMKNDLITVVPSKFTTMDENYVEKVIEIKCQETEMSGSTVKSDLETQACKSYLFPTQRGNLKIRFIDTPGNADTSGNYISNFENILSFVSDIKQLNAICVLLKPNVSRLTVEFEYCIKQLLFRLDKSAHKNLVFVFTNTRSTFYQPGETLPTLRELLKGMTDVSIPLSKDNIFCMDNEGFRFLAASKNDIKFDSKSIDGFSKSWKKSSREFCRMLHYIAGGGPNNNTPLEPHIVENIISISKARHVILKLSKPLADVTQLIQDNISLLEKHYASLTSSSDNLAELKMKLNMPFIDSIVTALVLPTTVCTTPTCCEIYEVNNVKKWHYKQRCHDPCSLQNVPREIIGSPELMHCAAMDGEHVCMQCTCSYEKHMHIYYQEKIVKYDIEDPDIQKKIEDEESVTTIASELIDKTRRRLKEFEDERETILKTMAKFAYFLKENDKMTHDDAYRRYLLFLIDREKSMDELLDSNVILEYNKTLERYEEEKQILYDAFQQSKHDTVTVTANDIINHVGFLYNLKHTGDKINLLYKSADLEKESTRDYNEYIHEPVRNVRSNSASSWSTSINSYNAEIGNDVKIGNDAEIANDAKISNDAEIANDFENKSENSNQHCNNDKATNTCQNLGFQYSNFHISTNCPNNCQNTNNQGVSTGGMRENSVPVGKNISFHFYIYDGVPQGFNLEKSNSP